MTRNQSALLPIAYVALRLVILFNWIFGACVLALLAWTFINEPWTFRALGLYGFPHSDSLLAGMRMIMVLGLVGVLIHYAILTRLLAIVVTVRQGDPFVMANAYRLHSIAWWLLGLQLLSLLIGAIGKWISTPEHPLHLDAGFSTSGWLGVLLTFVLARIFAEGAVMRQDLEGTV